MIARRQRAFYALRRSQDRGTSEVAKRSEWSASRYIYSCVDFWLDLWLDQGGWWQAKAEAGEPGGLG